MDLSIVINIRVMSQKGFIKTAGVIFLIVGVLHLLRVVNGWSMVAGSFVVPMWVSWAAFLLLGYLTYQGLIKKR